MSTHKSSLILLTPEPPAELIQKALDRLMSMDLADFASHLETARTMWRRFPELVIAPGFPEQLRTSFVEENGCDPDDDCLLAGEEALEAGYRESLLPQAVETARRWMQQEREEDLDAKFLGELGIAG